MREFFKGWRRKAAVVTLGLALAFLLGWARSLTTLDVLIITSEPKGVRQVFSNRSMIGLEKRWEGNILKLCRDRYWSDKAFTNDPLGTISPDGDWSFCGVRLRDGTDLLSGGRAISLLVPYYWIVAPLTLLSAWLLLRKPQPANPPAQQPT